MKSNIDLLLNKGIDKAYKLGEVPVACVITDNNGNIISYAYNKRESKHNALMHAELIAINKACKKLKSWRLENCNIYVTLEPCPMCCGAILQARFRKLYFYSLDPRNGSVISNANLLDGRYPQKVCYEYIPNPFYSKILSDFFKELRNKK